MDNISGYINPFSTDFCHTAEKFPELSAGSKILTIFFTSLAFLISIPLLGIGGYAVFRSLVDRLAPVDRSFNRATDKTANVGDKIFRQDAETKFTSTGARTKHQKVHVQEKKIRQSLKKIESELKTAKSELVMESLELILDKALDKGSSLDDQRKCLKDLADRYNKIHTVLQKSIKSLESKVHKQRESVKEKFTTPLSEIKTQYHQLEKAVQTDLVGMQAKIAKLFILFHSEIQKDKDSRFQTVSLTVLKEEENIADFLHTVFSKIEGTASDQMDIEEFEKLNETQSSGVRHYLSAFIRYVRGTNTETEKKTKVHEMVTGPVGEFRKELKHELDRREIEKQRSAARQQSTAKSKTVSSSSSVKGKTFGKVNASRRYAPPKIDPGGLHNLGNTCFMNSSLQVILNTPSLSALIDRDLPKPNWYDFSSREMDDEVFRYLDGVSIPEDEHLRRAVGSYREALEEHPKKVAHLKALRLLKDVYEGRNKDISLRNALSQLRNVVVSPKTRLVHLPSTYSQQDAAEFMTAALRGIGYSFKMRKTIESHDKKHSSFEELSYHYLSIPLVKKQKGSATFEELVDHFRYEVSDDPENVWNVTDDEGFVRAQYQKYTNTFEIVESIPDTLVIQLKRFERSSTGLRKISGQVEMGEEIDLRSMIDESLLEDSPSTRYRVVGVVHHGGGLGGGHYTADVKIGESWQHRSDLSVNSSPSLSSIEKNRKTGYMYVLERIK